MSEALSLPANPLLALRAAILAALGEDAELGRLMGGHVRIHDEPPRGAAPVYALFGPSEMRDDSVDGALRHTHRLGLILFGKPGSGRSAIEAAGRAAALLHEALLAPAGHALSLLRVEALSSQRDERSGETRATLTLQAVTERLPTS
ncbi:tail completion protein gp17 [Methylobacterium marchantiae]|uniref:DUF3168 domain-containing protein n=1 Tax=Methylobacterium marchantiae TaxID=600331 RepID=A0ABW3WYZ1_9HYPH|nr:hypothetical protein AIGOOFII_4073 [Methylobacterium marchantiae]